MKTLKISVVIASLCILFIGAGAFGQTRSYPIAPAYQSPTPGEIPILATYTFWQPEFITKEKFLEVKDAGFNMVGQALSLPMLDKTLEVVDGTGLKVKMFSWDALKAEDPSVIISKYSGNPLITAFSVKDEPKMDEFEATKKLNDAVMRGARGKLTTVNLLPSMDGKWLNAPDYRTYVEESVYQINPMVLSFDCYPVRLDKNGNIYVYDRYYDCFEVISDVAKKSGRPFYSYILSDQHNIYPKPREEYIRFQAFTGLAYGTQGLTYYTYTLPDFDKNKGEYSNAPIDQNGNKTDVWYAVRNVNREIRNLEKVFLGAEVLNVGHTGSSIPYGTSRLKSLPSAFRYIEGNGEGLLVSHLRNGNNEYIIILNRDVQNKQKVAMEKTRPLTRIYPDGKEKIDNSRTVTLSPGGYLIYRL